MTNHYVEDFRWATNDELDAIQAHAEFIRDMAVAAGIKHSTDFLDDLLAQGDAASQIQTERRRRGFEVIDRERRGFERQVLDEIRNRFDLPGEIGRTVHLFKAGRYFRGLCPFHEERTPSFTIYAEDGHYYCFGCGVHGDIFDWLQHQEGLAFPDAVRLAASRAGVNMAAETANAGRSEPFQTDEHGRWIGVLRNVRT